MNKRTREEYESYIAEWKARANDEKARAGDEKARADYEKARADDEKARADYEIARADYEKARADDEKARADYEKARAYDEKAKAERELFLTKSRIIKISSYEELEAKIAELKFDLPDYAIKVNELFCSHTKVKEQSSRGTNLGANFDMRKFRRRLLHDVRSLPLFQIQLDKERMKELITKSLFGENVGSMKSFLGRYSEKLLALRKVFVYTKVKIYECRADLNFDEVTQFQPFITFWLNVLVKELDPGGNDNGEVLPVNYAMLRFKAIFKGKEQGSQSQASSATQFSEKVVAGKTDLSIKFDTDPATAQGEESDPASDDELNRTRVIVELKSPFTFLRTNSSIPIAPKDQTLAEIAGLHAREDGHQYCFGLLTDLFACYFLFRNKSNNLTYISDQTSCLDVNEYVLHILYAIAVAKNDNISPDDFIVGEQLPLLESQVGEQEGSEDANLDGGVGDADADEDEGDNEEVKENPPSDEDYEDEVDFFQTEEEYLYEKMEQKEFINWMKRVVQGQALLNAASLQQLGQRAPALSI